MMKAEMIEELTIKVRRAHPWVKKDFLSGLKYKTKAQLQELLQTAKVTRSGDISFI